MEGVPSKGGHPRGNSFLVGVVPKRGPSKVGEPSKEVYSMGPIQGGGGRDYVHPGRTIQEVY